MKNNIIASIFVFSSIGLFANSSFTANYFPMEISGGQQIEVFYKQELPEKDFYYNTNNTQDKLFGVYHNHEKMLQLVNQITKSEKEVKEELPF